MTCPNHYLIIINMLVTILVQNSKAVNEDFNEVQKTSNIFNVRVMLGVYESVLVGI